MCKVNFEPTLPDRLGAFQKTLPIEARPIGQVAGHARNQNEYLCRVAKKEVS
jgi:hypothetical protein